MLLYLLLTMAPFAIVAPILGPMLDRMRGGRRLLVVASAAGRAVLCLFMAMYVSEPAPEGLLVYPLAFGVLVLAKGHSIAKSALVPALVKSDDELVNANSRLALLSVIAATVGGMPAAGIQQLFGADWSLRVGAVVFVVAAVFAIEDPDAPASVPTRTRELQTARGGGDAPAEHPARRQRDGRAARRASGFLAFFAAFALKGDLVRARGRARGECGRRLPRGGRRAGAAPVGARGGDPRRSLVLPAVFALLGALFGDAIGFVVAAFALAVGAAAGRLGFDSVLQRDGPDAVRGRAFARFETRFQLVWVVGGMLGLIPSPSRSGLLVLAVVLGFAAFSYVAALRAASKRGMRTKLLPDSVDRAIARSRRQAMGRVRQRFRKPARAGRRPPPEPPPEPPPMPPGDATGGQALLAPAARRALHHAERADRPAEAVDHQHVDLLTRGDALLDRRVRLADHGAVDAVGDEAPRAVGESVITTGFLPHASARSTIVCTVASVVCVAAHDLGEAHHHRRRRPVPADHQLRAAGDAGDLADREPRRVRRQDRARRRGGVEVAEHLLLQLELLGHRFDHDVGLRRPRRTTR